MGNYRRVRIPPSTWRCVLARDTNLPVLGSLSGEETRLTTRGEEALNPRPDRDGDLIAGDEARLAAREALTLVRPKGPRMGSASPVGHPPTWTAGVSGTNPGDGGPKPLMGTAGPTGTGGPQPPDPPLIGTAGPTGTGNEGPGPPPILTDQLAPCGGEGQ